MYIRKTSLLPYALMIIPLALAALSCNLPVSVTEPSPTSTVEQPFTLTPEVGLLESATPDLLLTITAQAALLEAATSIPTLTSTASVQESATAEFTNTPSSTTVTVSRNTNCRKGPGAQYDINGAVLIGQVAEVIGKNTSTNYWIIKNPDNPSTTCWLWGQYATVSGDTSGLKSYEIPSTPTLTLVPAVAPAAPSNLSEQNTCTKDSLGWYPISGTFTWTDNSNNEKGFNIYLRYDIDGQPDRFEGSVGANITSYNYSAYNLGRGIISLKVEAFNDSGASARKSIDVNLSGCP